MPIAWTITFESGAAFVEWYIYDLTDVATAAGLRGSGLSMELTEDGFLTLCSGGTPIKVFNDVISDRGLDQIGYWHPNASPEDLDDYTDAISHIQHHAFWSHLQHHGLHSFELTGYVITSGEHILDQYPCGGGT